MASSWKLIAGAAGLVLLLCFVPAVGSDDLQLPTPLESYESYDPQAEALALLQDMSQGLEMSEKLRAIALFSSFQSGKLDAVPVDELRHLLEAVDWEEYRGRILRLLIYQSGILDAFRGESARWRPFVNDFLLFFLSHLSKERLLDRIAAQLVIPPQDQNRRLIALADRVPSLQKIGQIMARHPDLPSNIRKSLQTFENSIKTTRRDDVVDFITKDIGPAKIAQLQMQFDDKLLAEASIGAVIRARVLLPGDPTPRDVVCKVLKPYAVEGLKEELVILDELVHYFEEHGQFYNLGQAPLSRMFEDAREALSREIKVVEEQANLARAADYYRDSLHVKIPEVYPISTPHVTVMEFIDGGKIVNAFPGDAPARAHLAEILDETLTWDVIFAPQETAVFHGDPHAGNVLYMKSDHDHIALIDWGLCGTLPRPQRARLIQLLLGVYLKDKKRVRNNVDALLEIDLQEFPQHRERIQAIALNVLDSSRASDKDQFLVLNDMVAQLARAGYSLDFNLVLFIKSQVTIMGILQELDPDWRRSTHARKEIGGRVFREAPKRLLNTIYFPGWTSHGYPSMISNEDVRDVQFHALGRGFNKLGSGIWKGIGAPFRAGRSVPAESAGTDR